MRSEHEHLPAEPLPLFEIRLRNAQSKQEETISANQGWQQVTFRETESGVCEIRWSRPTNEALGDVTVLARVIPEQQDSALHWQLDVSGQRDPWGLWRVKFPQLELVAPGDDPAFLFPRGPGEVQRDVWKQAFSYQGLYPNGWTTMQFMAVYDQSTRCGLYAAIHDPLGSTKDLSATTRQPAATLLLAADHPVENMGQPGNRFVLRGTAVWQAFSGDWFDAATIYRKWVRRKARWYPDLSDQGRDDTPLWMRELCVWAQTGGAASECVEPVSRFAAYMGLPTGFHWYSWHQIPFDNDYPHYFPAKDGFQDGVKRLHEAQVYVMPYINGRLWDTRDRGLEDFEYTQQALPAATKDEQGQPFTEMYGSKESDDSRVSLAVMCPETVTWRDKVASIVRRLFQECNVDGVYIDQIAAAAPKLCMDASHDHPLGGGDWWMTGYQGMLELIRRMKKPECMLTSECNAEPFVRWFDGYLTWHWQHDGQVPAFPAVYGGAIQMFGRAYRGGETKDLALRMKSSQQLVYGEQIGWIHPGVIDEADNGPFLREVVRLRWHLRKYFYAGEMLRPPTLSGTIPQVRADWQWQSNWWVTTDAVLTGAWSLPQEKRVVAMFVNVSDEALEADWTFDASDCGLDAPNVMVARVTAEGKETATTAPATFRRQLTFPPRSAVAFEITASTE